LGIIVDESRIDVGGYLPGYVAAMATLFPAILRVSTAMPDSVAWISVSTVEWTLVPLYVFEFVVCTLPALPQMRDVARQKGAALTWRGRMSLLLTWMGIGVIMLSDFRLLDGVPTFANGGLIFPLDEGASVIFRGVYESPIYRDFFISISPVTTVSLWYAFLIFAINWKAYFVRQTAAGAARR
jgi:hypothetical protein